MVNGNVMQFAQMYDYSTREDVVYRLVCYLSGLFHRLLKFRALAQPGGAGTCLSSWPKARCRPSRRPMREFLRSILVVLT